jgi:hypothetical protein
VSSSLLLLEPGKYTFDTPPPSCCLCAAAPPPPRTHTQVVELEGVFQLLRGDVERLFLQAPCVDLDALGQQLTEAEAAAEEQASTIQVGTRGMRHAGRCKLRGVPAVC